MQTLTLAPKIVLTNSTRRVNLWRRLKRGYAAQPSDKVFRI